MELDLINFLIGFIVVVGAAIFLLTNFPKIEAVLQNKLENSLDREVEDKSAEPLHEIFLGFAHDSTASWVKWVETQDPEFKETAYQNIVKYLANEPEQLGSVTGDAVKAIASFKKETDFSIIMNLLKNVREKFQRFKTIDMFYQDAATILVKINEFEAIDFLNSELEHYLNQLDSDKIQGYIIRALFSVTDDKLLAPILTSCLCNYQIKRSIKVEIIYIVEKRDQEFQKEVYGATLSKILRSGVEYFSEDDIVIIEQIFQNSKKFLIEGQETYDERIWHAVIEFCETPKLRTQFIKLISDFLENSEQQLTHGQIVTLLAKNEPAKSSFREALIKRHSLTTDELTVIKPPIKIEDLYFHKQTLALEKSKKTKTVLFDLLDDYNSLEKIISLNDFGKADKAAQGAVNLIAGESSHEKLYILRTLAANTNKSFIYVDLGEILKANFEVTNLKNMANNCKPCIVYLDNITEALVSDLSKGEELHLKELNKAVQDLSLTPNIFFCANLPYERETLKVSHPTLSEVLASNQKGNFRILYSIDNPDEKKKMEILFKFQEKISENKLNDSPEYDAHSIIALSKSKSMLEYLFFLSTYFESGLLIYGTIRDVYEFEKEIAPIILPDLANLKPPAELVEETITA